MRRAAAKQKLREQTRPDKSRRRRAAQGDKPKTRPPGGRGTGGSALECGGGQRALDYSHAPRPERR